MSDVPTAPAFARHFTDPLYDDLAGEFAPFGTDEGADLLADWSARTDELTGATTVRDLLADRFGDVDALVAEALGEAVDVAGMVIGAGFTLLRLTGRIDPEGLRWTLGAIEATERWYGEVPEMAQLRRDLLAFTG